MVVLKYGVSRLVVVIVVWWSLPCAYDLILIRDDITILGSIPMTINGELED